jgi:hypothetical protein
LAYILLQYIVFKLFPYGRRATQKIIYIFAVTIICLSYELLSLKTGFFYYNTWKLWYSALCYPFLLSIIALNLWLSRKMYGNK